MLRVLCRFRATFRHSIIVPFQHKHKRLAFIGANNKRLRFIDLSAPLWRFPGRLLHTCGDRRVRISLTGRRTQSQNRGGQTLKK